MPIPEEIIDCGTTRYPRFVRCISIGAEIKSQILIDEVKLGMLKKTLKPNHPEVEKLKHEIIELEGQFSELEGQSNDSSEKGRGLFPQYSEVPNLGIKLMRLINFC